MAFNWFRRQHNDSTDTSSEKKQAEKPATQETTKVAAATPTTDTTPTDAADLLAFAKAAYKNIQEKQSQTQETPVSEPVAETPAEQGTVTTEETTVTEPVTEATQEVKAETVQEEVATEATQEVEPETQPVAATEATQEVEPQEVEPQEVEPETQPVAAVEEETQTPAPANLSFLERAAAERQAKQERLIASAIEVPEPEELQTTTVAQETEESEEIPGLAFDEGFLWTAEVLAAQGRRAEDVSIEEITWLKKLRQGLDKTRRNILNQLKAIVGQGPLNQAAVSEIEALLLQADVGVEATDYIIESLQEKLRSEVLPPEEAIAYLKKILRDMLEQPLQKSQKIAFVPEKEALNIWLITGVNGAGKTTTIGKLAHLANKSGYKCLIGAADTFRAAAVEQVKVWGQRSGVEVIANPGKNTDPAAVVFDAIAAAQARETELLLVDTAGRLQNKKNLMEELSKIRRIIDKKAPNAKVESLLVLDATLGQNGLRQAEVFSQAAQLNGVVLTKLDSTAKGGVALAVVQQLGLPIRFIGAGEGIEDLRPFSSYEFVEALLNG